MPFLITFSTDREEFDLLRSKWGWLLAAGIAFIIVGLLALANAFLATVASVFFVGVMMMIGGVAQIIYAFQVKGWGQFFLWLLIGILYVAAGLFAFADPLLVSAVLTLLFALSVLVTGVFRLVAGYSLRSSEGWGWLVAGGVVAVIAAAIVFAGWPVNSLWLIGALLAIDLLFYGITLVVFALFLRRGQSASQRWQA